MFRSSRNVYSRDVYYGMENIMAMTWLKSYVIEGNSEQ